MATKIVPDEATRKRLNAIEDLRDRLIAAAKTLGEARTKKANFRYERTVAAAVLHTKYGPESGNTAALAPNPKDGWTKAAIYNGLFAMARPQLDRDLSKITGDIPDLTEADALRKAKKEHARWLLQRAIEDAAYPIFLDMIHSLARRKPGDEEGEREIEGISNAEIARMCGRSTARIAQIMTGNTNTSRIARREREKRIKAEGDLAKASGL
jgi:hypothetical protein